MARGVGGRLEGVKESGSWMGREGRGLAMNGRVGGCRSVEKKKKVAGTAEEGIPTVATLPGPAGCDGINGGRPREALVNKTPCGPGEQNILRDHERYVFPTIATPAEWCCRDTRWQARIDTIKWNDPRERPEGTEPPGGWDLELSMIEYHWGQTPIYPADTLRTN